MKMTDKSGKSAKNEMNAKNEMSRHNKVDLETFLSVSEQMSGLFLQDGKIAILSDRSGMSQVWEYDTKQEDMVQRTDLSERVWRLLPAPGREGLFFTSDAGGNENEQVFYLAPDAKEPERLTHTDMARFYFAGATPDREWIRLCSNARDQAHFDVVQINTKTQEVDLVIENNDHYNIPVAISDDGRYMLTNKLRAQSDNPLYLVDYETRTQRPLIKDAPPAAYEVPVFSHDGEWIYFTTDAYDEFLGVYRIGVTDEEGEPELVYQDSNDVDRIAISHDDRYLAMCVNFAGASELWILDLETGVIKNVPSVPLGCIFTMDFAPDSHQLLFSFSSGTRPWSLWILDIDNDELRRLSFHEDPLAEVNMVEPHLSSFYSFDELEVPYWRYIPHDAGYGPYPTIIHIHGGPEGQAWPMYDGMLQYFLQEGFVVVDPNVRGSTGFGKTYHHLDDVDKRLDSVKDIAALAEHLIETGITEAGQLAVMGASYGGYMTLSALVHAPEYWACGCDIVGMSDLETFLENTADYRRAHRSSEYGTLEHDRETLRRVSPIHKIEQIKAPLMVIHGANDPRVPVTEAEQIVERLREQGNEVQYLRYENEGHGLARLENRIDAYTQVVDFFRESMGLN